MHRTGKTRHVGGALILVIAIVMSVFFGGRGGPPQAEDTATPSSEPSPSAATTDAEPTDPASPDATESSGSGLDRQLLGIGAVTAVPDDLAWKRGLQGSVSVYKNDSCPST